VPSLLTEPYEIIKLNLRTRSFQQPTPRS